MILIIMENAFQNSQANSATFWIFYYIFVAFLYYLEIGKYNK